MLGTTAINCESKQDELRRRPTEEEEEEEEE